MYSKYITALLSLGATLSAATPVQVEKRAALSSSCASKLSALGVQLGSNAASSSGGSIWAGNDGPYTVSFKNKHPEEVCLVVWGTQAGYQSSFVGAVAPVMTVSIPPHSDGDVVLSFADGTSGAWAPVRSNTKMSQYGQIFNTWGEFTMSSMGVVDVSREVNAHGDRMHIKTPTCTTSMTRCVFKCIDPNASTCGDAGSYQLENCSAGSQPGAQASTDGFNGGCGWNGASSASMTAVFRP